MNRSEIINKLSFWADLTPNSPAVIYKNFIITYKEFYDKVESISNKILSKTKGENLIIPVRMSNELDVVFVIYALIKANAAYLPLPKEITLEKCSTILNNIETEFYITDIYEEKIGNKEKVFFDEILKWENCKNEVKYNYEDDNYFYVMYTSGTTGNPKGCLIQDKSICHRLITLDSMFPFGKNHRYLYSTNYSFDVSTTEIFGWIFGGGSLVVYDKTLSATELPGLLKKEKITHMAFAPSYFRTFFKAEIADFFQGLKYIFLAGEKLDVDLARKILQYIPRAEVYNLYGPTEASVYCTCFSLKDLKNDNVNVPIGKPIKGVDIKINTGDGHIGEILIGGIGVAEGYYKNNKLTSEKFVLMDDRIYYKSGDLGSFDDEGNIIFHGRTDNQIKINGVRVEAEEVEIAIKKLINASNVVVRLVKIKEKTSLAAYIETGETNIDLKELQNKLAKKLERYFVPKLFLLIKEFPLDKNKKIDFRELERQLLDGLKKGIEDSTEITLREKEIIYIWADILKVDMDTEGDFFLLGGDSLDTIVMITEIEERFGVKLSIEDVIKHSTVKALAEFLDILERGENENSFIDFWKKYSCFTPHIENREKILYVKNEIEKDNILKNINDLDCCNKPEKIIIDCEEYSPLKKISLKIPFLSSDLNKREEFPLFSRQEFYIRKNFKQYLVKRIEVGGKPIEKIISSINSLIKDQILFRSVISKGVFVEKELKKIDFSDINQIDLSHVDFKKYEDYMNTVIIDMLSSLKELDMEDRFLYEILIVKKSIDRFEVVFFVNHHIIDGHGINVLEKTFLDLCYNKIIEKGEFSYKNFVKDVIETNNDEAVLRLMDTSYYKNLKNVVNTLNDELIVEKTTQSYEFVIDNFENNKKKRGDLLFDKISQLIFETTGIKKQAFQILKNLKSFRAKDYSTQIGDFHVSIFVNFDCELEKNLFTKSELFYENIYLKENFHLDYLCSSDKYHLNQNMNIFQQVPFSINYLGEITEGDLQSWKKNLDVLVSELSKLHSNKIRITCFNCKDKSYIYFLNGMIFPEYDKKIKK